MKKYFWLWFAAAFIFLVSVQGVCAQMQGLQRHPGKPPLASQRIMKALGKSSGALNLGLTAQSAQPSDVTIIDPGLIPGGTWANLHGINDFGVAVGFGNVGDDIRIVGVPLFGGNAGTWFESGHSIKDTLWGEEGVAISGTGLIVGTIQGDFNNDGNFFEGKAYAFYPNHEGTELGKLEDDLGSAAICINHRGTIIAGTSYNRSGAAPVAWTRKPVRHGGQPTWEIHALPTGGFEKPGAVFKGISLSWWGCFGVNDLGQITGDAWTHDANWNWWEIAVVWNPIGDGEEWEIQQLPKTPHLQYTEALAINNSGEIVGDVWGGTKQLQGAFPALWKKGTQNNKYSVTVLPTTAPELNYGWSVAWGINDIGDIVGYCSDENWIGRAARWNTLDLNFVASLGFPGDTSWALGVNNLGIAVGGGQTITGYDLDGNPIYSDPQPVAVRFR